MIYCTYRESDSNHIEQCGNAMTPPSGDPVNASRTYIMYLGMSDAERRPGKGSWRSRFTMKMHTIQKSRVPVSALDLFL
jgi:hypothetical protein